MRHRYLGVIALACLGLVGCETAADRQAADQSRCSGYGFQPGTEAFAQCMMTADMRREAQDEAAKDRRASIMSGSRSRNGNSSYPVCSAISSESVLDVSTGKWAGPSCRQE